MVAAAIVGSAVVGGVGQVISGNQAASAQQSAAQNATNAQMQMFNTTLANLQPYNQTGQNALQRANALAGTFNFQPTMAQLSQTPGYQFTLNQGLKSTQNAAAARGLGTSGAALKAAGQYATGLAQNTYQNQFQNALQGYQANIGSLQNIANLGENAAAGVGNAATQTGGQIGSNIIGAGNAAAGAYMNTGNAIGNAAGSVGSGILSNNLINLINGMYGNAGNVGVQGGMSTGDFNNYLNNLNLTPVSAGDYYTAGI